MVQKFILILWHVIKGGDENLSPRAGRPTDNPKSGSIHVRLDQESERILENYVKKAHVTKAEAVRIGIKKLEN